MKRLVLMTLALVGAGSLAAKTFNADHTLTAAEAKELIATGTGTSAEGIEVAGGTLTIGVSLAKWGGDIVVRNGARLKATIVGSLGNDTGTTTVESGGTLEFSFAGTSDTSSHDGSKNCQNEMLFVAGSGTDGEGCIYYTGTKAAYYTFGKITLTDDAVFGEGTSYRWDVRNGTSGVFDLGGHNLTLNTLFGITGVTVKNAGTITLGNTLYLEGSGTKWQDCENGRLVVGEKSVNSQGAAACPLAIEVNGGTLSSWNAYSANTVTNYSRLTGPMTVGANGLNVTYNPGCAWTFAGKISGTGKITVSHPGGKASATETELLHLLNAENDWTGGLVNKGVTVIAWHEGTLPGYDVAGRYSCSNEGVIVAKVGSPDGWSESAVLAARQAMGDTAHGGGFGVASDAAYAFAAEVSGANPFAHAGAGALTLTTPGATWPELVNKSGEMSVIPATTPEGVSTFSGALVADGTVTIKDAGYLEYAPSKDKSTIKVESVNRPSVGRLVLDGNTAIVSPANSTNTTYVGMSMFNVKELAPRGILELKGDGVALTNDFRLGYNSKNDDSGRNVQGAVYQRGGSHYLKTTSTPSMGAHSGGYYELTGGLFHVPGWFHCGTGWNSNNANPVPRGYGQVRIKGGKLLANGTNCGLTLGHIGGMGELYQTGGEFEDASEVHVCKSIWDCTAKGSRCTMTVAGEGHALVKEVISLASQSNSLAVLNLNGNGVLEAQYIQKVTNSLILANSNVTPTRTDAARATAFDDNLAYVNFNGGTFRQYERTAYTGKTANHHYGNISNQVFYAPIDRITVYAGGAKFDTAGYDALIDQPIRAPEGKGVASVPWDFSKFAAWDYIAPPHVEIFGDGVGATAVAEFDSQTGLITGITVTSPGSGYTTARAVIDRGGVTNSYEIALDDYLAPQAAGPLVKKGEGTLTVASANGFAGATTVEGGTLKLANADAIPLAAGVNLTGGALDLGGLYAVIGPVTATAGEIRGGCGTVASVVKAGPGTFNLAAPVTVSGDVVVEEGALRLPVRAPGVVHGWQAGVDSTARSKKPVFTNGGTVTEFDKMTIPCASDCFWSENGKTATWSGYLWNDAEEDEVWSFAANMDDGVGLWIDDTYVDLTRPSGSTWGTVFFGKVTLSPGRHKFYFHAWNGSGAGGVPSSASGTSNWPKYMGFAYSRTAYDETSGEISHDWNDGWSPVGDPGDGSLLTATPDAGDQLPTLTSLTFGPGTTLDLMGGSWTFPETVVGMPSNVVGSVAVPGLWEIDADSVLSGETLEVSGTLTFDEGSALVLPSAEGLDSAVRGYEIATAAEIVGRPAVVDAAGNVRSDWKAAVVVGTSLQLKPVRGMAVIVR